MTAGAQALRRAAHRRAEQLMTDAVLIEQRVPGAEYDPVTLEAIPRYESLYEGKCRVQRPQSQGVEAVAGDLSVAVDQVELQLPWSAPHVPRNCRVTITAVDSLSVAEVGMVANVEADLTKTDASKRTLSCKVVSADERSI